MDDFETAMNELVDLEGIEYLRKGAELVCSMLEDLQEMSGGDSYELGESIKIVEEISTYLENQPS